MEACKFKIGGFLFSSPPKTIIFLYFDFVVF